MAPGKSPKAPKQRLPWVDAGRGLAVVLVVLLHVTIGHYYLMPWAEGAFTGRWDRINQILSVVRLPLLFTLSGMLASTRILKGWRRGNSFEAMVSNSYTYLIWLGLYGLFILALPGDYSAPHKVSSLEEWLIQIFLPNTYLWYILGLVVLTGACTLLRKVPPLVVLLLALQTHALASYLWTMESPLWTRIPTYALYFVLGVYGRPFLTFMAKSPLATLVAALGSYLIYSNVGITRLMSLSIPSPSEVWWLVAFYLFMGATVVGMVGLLVRVPFYSWAGSLVGRHTLGIYILHVPVITLGNLLLLRAFPGTLEGVPSHPTLHLLYPLLATAVVVLACGVADKLLMSFALTRTLFTPPAELLKWARGAARGVSRWRAFKSLKRLPY